MILISASVLAPRDMTSQPSIDGPAGHSKKRNVYHGESTDLLEVLRPHARHVSFVSYPIENRKVAASTLHVESVLAHVDLLHSLKALQPIFSIPKLKLEAALRAIGVDNKSWFCDDDAMEDWVTTIAARLRNMCHCVGHAEKKKKPPSWLSKMPWREDFQAAPQKRQQNLRNVATPVLLRLATLMHRLIEWSGTLRLDWPRRPVYREK